MPETPDNQQSKSAAELLRASLSSNSPLPQVQKSAPKEGRNKYVLLMIAGALLLGGGIIYRLFFIPTQNIPVSTGIVKEFTIIAKKDTWSFIPDEIVVDRGDKVVLTVVNEDSYDHGIGIDAFGISQRMPANETIKIEFVATQLGDFNYYCSVPCGEGEVEGKNRDHFDMTGKIKVREASTQQ